MSPTDPIEDWWCCMNGVERFIATSVGLYAIGDLAHIPVVTYDALWAGTGAPSALKRAEQFRLVFALTPGVYVDPITGDEIDVYYLGAWWLAFLAFSLDPGLACAEQCKVLRFNQ